MRLNFTKREDKSLAVSVPRNRVVHGVPVKKLPVGAYIRAMQDIENIPALLVEKAFPGEEMQDILTRLVGLDKDRLFELLGRLLTTIPRELCCILSSIIGTPEERLLDENHPDPLSLNDLMDVLLAFWELNDLTAFFTGARRLTSQLSARNTGSNTGLQ